MGPISRYLGPRVPPSRSSGRTRCPRSTTTWSATPTSPRSRRKVLDSGLSVSQLVATAWASAASFRGTDKRGGANGARIRLAPQKDWAVNEPAGAGHGAADARGHPAGLQRAVRRRQGLAGRPDRARRLRRGREGGRRTPATTSRCRSRPAAPTRRRSRPTSSRSPCSSRPPTASATTAKPARSCRPRRCCSSGPTS